MAAIWNFAYKKVAYNCKSGNQARIFLKGPINKNHQYKFKWNNISRWAINYEGLSNHLI